MIAAASQIFSTITISLFEVKLNLKYTAFDLLILQHIAEITGLPFVPSAETASAEQIIEDIKNPEKMQQILQKSLHPTLRLFFALRTLKTPLTNEQSQQLLEGHQKQPSNNEGTAANLNLLKQLVQHSVAQSVKNGEKNTAEKLPKLPGTPLPPYFHLLHLHMQISQRSISLEEVYQSSPQNNEENKDIVETFQQIACGAERTYILSKLALTARKNGKLKESLAYYDANQRVLAQLKEANKEHPSLHTALDYFEIVNQINTAHVQQDAQASEKALLLCEAAQFLLQKSASAQQNEFKQLEAQILNNMASLLVELQEFERALDYALRAVEINQRLQYDADLAANLVNISAIYQTMEEYDDALAYAKRAQEIFERLQKANATSAEAKRQLAVCLANIGFLYQARSKFYDSFLYNKKALSLMLEIDKQSTDIAGIYFNMSTLCQLQGDLPKALEYARFSHNTYSKFYKEDAERHQNVLDVQEHIVELLEETGKKEEALTTLQKVYVTRKEHLPLNEQLLACAAHLVQLHLELKQAEEAKKISEELKVFESRVGIKH